MEQKAVICEHLQTDCIFSNNFFLETSMYESIEEWSWKIMGEKELTSEMNKFTYLRKKTEKVDALFYGSRSQMHTGGKYGGRDPFFQNIF